VVPKPQFRRVSLWNHPGASPNTEFIPTFIDRPSRIGGESLDRRELLKSALTGTLALGFPSLLRGQSSEKFSVIDGGGTNVVAFSSVDGVILVDSGAPKSGDKVKMALGSNAKVQTLFNTHYHLDQTGNNEMFAAAGAKIIAHQHTRQWMSTDYWVPDENRYEKARPIAAQPTETFQTTGTFKAGTEQIDCGHLPLAHTDGDIYVFFRTSNVLAAGDVASPLRDPALDYFTGAWIGGRVDAMDVILKLSNEQTRIVPASGPVMTRAEFKAERDMMEEVRSRVWKQTLKGDSPKDMLEGGVLNGLPRTWKDPYKFLYDAAKGMFAHHNKLDPAVI
jgi:glyoxylase-like metal-dependent hydrolase (beta-lactamase superfamily II)